MDLHNYVKQENTGLPPRQRTILVAEDEDIVRLVLEEMLLRLGYHVIATANGTEALEKFSQQPNAIDLVVFDMSMPLMSGDVLFDHLQRAAPGLKMLLTSGFTDTSPVLEMRKRGLTGFLPKPFTIQQVRDVLELVFTDNGSSIGCA